MPTQKSEFKTLFENGRSVTIHLKNLYDLVIEIYKVKNDISPDVMSDNRTFQENSNYNLRSGIHLGIKNMRTTLFGRETVSHLGVKIWPLKIC